MLIHQMVVIPMVESTKNTQGKTMALQSDPIAETYVKVLFFHPPVKHAQQHHQKKQNICIGFTACNVYREIGGKNLGMEGP